MARQRLKLNISNCIVYGDAKRLKDGKKPVKTLRRLTYILIKKDSFSGPTVEALYHKLYRCELHGFFANSEEIENIIKDICEVLMVDEKELVINF